MKKIIPLLIIAFLFACSDDEQLVNREMEDGQLQSDFIARVNDGDFDDSKLGLYKGVFTTKDGATRATVYMENNGKDIPVAIIKTSNGATYKLTASQKMSKGKESEGIVFANSEASFNFSVDEKGENIIVEDVSLAGKESDIIMAKQTSKAPLETVTGTYTCVDCSTHPTLGDQPETQTFNFMFSGTGEGATVTTQVTLLGRVYGSEGTTSDVTGGSGLTQTNCEVNGNFTTCDLVTGDPAEEGSIALFGDSGPVFITGVHTYNNQTAGTNCSSVSATMTYESTKYGTSVLSIQSDESSDCEIPGPQVLIFEDFEDTNVEYVQTRRVDTELIDDDLVRLAQNRYYGILLNQDAPNVSYEGRIGEGYYGAQNINSAEVPVNRIRMTYSDVDISSYSLLDFSLFFATDDESVDGDWDQTARAGVEYSFDGGVTWEKVLAVEAGPGDPEDDQENDFVYEDVDFDGVGDVAGTRITNTFTQLERQLATDGNSSIDIRIYIRVLNNDQEDVALDNFLVTAQ